ncbi:MAG: YbaB/EbfC family nucleoid-associated protein [Flavobacteriaceae bacterium]|nr:YbaB/EbfC family nucleoid-associated protein [Flavobacteriaceae bacterium]
MFGDVSGMMRKLKETQVKIEQTKIRMDTILIDEKSNNNLVQVTVTANSVIKNIDISKALTDPEEIADYVLLTLNKALEKAREINERELAITAKDGMPAIPGMDMFK